MVLNKVSIYSKLDNFFQGELVHAYEIFGAHLVNEDGVDGVRFTLWAPNAKRVAVVGDFNSWSGLGHIMTKIYSEGIWSIFIPDLEVGDLYKYEIYTKYGECFLKADPFAFFSEVRPKTASRIYSLNNYSWKDDDWQAKKTLAKPFSTLKQPINIYEVHLGSWKKKPNNDFYNYRELAPILAEHVLEMGYTHVELMPIMEHPYDGSWGYQITGYYCVTSRYGSPEDFQYFVDYFHQRGIGVILDWVPAHFCKDSHGLATFDGTNLYEKNENHQWGTLHFDFSKPEIASFLISNAVFWLDVFHIDGLRIDAVASMLYLDYGIKDEFYEPNQFGGKEAFEAVTLLKKLTDTISKFSPQSILMAEDSSEWPMVTGPTYLGGLGFNFKWNMGWMNDILLYMEKDPIYRKWHHNLANFSLMYAFKESFVLPLSHDEVVHGKKSLIEKMPGDYWHKFANLRLLMSFMIAHPGKKLSFMGNELAQFIEWRFYEELEWNLLDFPMHKKYLQFIKVLNHFYLTESCLWQDDTNWLSFKWIDADNAQQSILSFIRIAEDTQDLIIIVCNFTPVFYESYRLGVSSWGSYLEVFNSDSLEYGGSGKINPYLLTTENIPWNNQPYSINLQIPPLAAVYLKLNHKDR